MFHASSVECPKPAKTVGTTGLGPRQHLPGEGVLEPLPRSFEILLMFVIETNQETKDEGGKGLEGAVVG